MMSVLPWQEMSSEHAVGGVGRAPWIRSIAGVALAAGLGVATLGGCSPAGGRGGGELAWVQRYNGPGNYKDLPAAVAISPDGHTVFVTGRSAGVSLTADYATIAYDTNTGARRWVSRYSGPGNGLDAAAAIAVSPDGSAVFVTGQSAQKTGWAFVTIAYNSADGSRLGLGQYPGYRPISVVVGPDGQTVFVTGAGINGSRDDFLTVAYEAASGTMLWAARYSGPGGGAATPSELAVSPDGGTVYVTGPGPSGRGVAGTTTVAYSAATGRQVWAMQSAANPLAMTLSRSGSTIFVSGAVARRVRGHWSRHYCLIAYNASTGTRRCARLYPVGGSQPAAASATSSPDDRMVFVTGSGVRHRRTPGAGPYLTVTAAYGTATGRPLWVRRNDASSGGGTVAVSPDGRTVYVTSTAPAGPAPLDDIVLAYRAPTRAPLQV